MDVWTSKRERISLDAVDDSQKTLFSLKTFKIDSILALSLMNWYGFSQKSCTFVA